MCNSGDDPQDRARAAENDRPAEETQIQPWGPGGSCHDWELSLNAPSVVLQEQQHLLASL